MTILCQQKYRIVIFSSKRSIRCSLEEKGKQVVQIVLKIPEKSPAIAQVSDTNKKNV